MKPQFTSTFETGKHYRVHKSYIWMGPLLAAVAVFTLVLLNGMQGWIQLIQEINRNGGHLNAPLIIVVCIAALAIIYALLIGLYALGYKNMSYAFDEREFSFYSGIITKRHVHVPYARIQSVNHKASIPQRIVGVCTITIDSAGGAQNKAVRVPFVQLDVAERMRTELFMRKAAIATGAPLAPGQFAPQPHAMPVPPGAPQQAAAPGTPPPQGARFATQTNSLDEIAGDLGDLRGIWGGEIAGLEPVAFEAGLNNTELLLTGFSHGTPLILALSIGIPTILTVLGIFSLDTSAGTLFGFIALPISIGVFIICYLLGVLGVAISYGRFKVRRRGTRIEVERGLLQRSFSGIDLDRVQSVEIRQSFVRRLMGYCELSLGRVNAQSGGDASNQNSSLDARGLVIHPFIKLDQVDELLGNLAPELMTGRPRVPSLKPLPRIALRRSILRNCLWYNWAFWCALVIIPIWIAVVHNFARTPGLALSQTNLAFGIALAICAISTAIGAVHAVLWARGSGYAWSSSFVALRNDGLFTSYIAIPRNTIQSGNTRVNPFQRRLKLASIVATTAAGTTKTSSHLMDLPQEDAEAYLDWLKPRRKANE